MNTILQKVNDIVLTLRAKIPGCSPVSVGGCVRDALLNNSNNIIVGFENAKDFDLEIFGATPVQVQESLSNICELELVGIKFPVFKVCGFDIDISFPRREFKTGLKHTDFDVFIDPFMSFTAAAYRRDFTVNAIGYEWSSGKILDPYEGTIDLKYNLLRPVSERFKEDALRIMRAFKFIARYGFEPSKETIQYSSQIVNDLNYCARERLVPEWNDFILRGKSTNVSRALNFLVDTGAINLYPELAKLTSTPQQPEHHPEGNVWVHTIHCMEQYTELRETWRGNDIGIDKLNVGYAVLTHDMGKGDHTVIENGRITSKGHEDSDLPRRFVERIFDPADERINQVVKLVKAHMKPTVFCRDNSGMKAVKKLFISVDGRIEDLCALVFCDQMGRPPLKPSLDEITWMRRRVSEITLTNNKIEPIIKGRHLIAHLNMKPSPSFGHILNEMFEAQLDEKFTTEMGGIAFLKERYLKQ